MPLTPHPHRTTPYTIPVKPQRPGYFMQSGRRKGGVAGLDNQFEQDSEPDDQIVGREGSEEKIGEEDQLAGKKGWPTQAYRPEYLMPRCADTTPKLLPKFAKVTTIPGRPIP